MSKATAHTAIRIMSWLVDMCAPNPADIIGSRNPPELRASWLDRAEPRPWLPIDAKTSREPWLLADAGFIELQHRGPAVMHVSRSKVTATSYPAARLTARGVVWCRLALTEDGAAQGALADIVAHVLLNPTGVAKIIEVAVEQHPELAALKVAP